MKILKLTLLVGIVAISTSCTKQDLAELKPDAVRSGAEVKTDLTIDSVRTTRLIDDAGAVSFQDKFYITPNETKSYTIGFSTVTFITGHKIINLDNKRYTMNVYRSMPNVKYSMYINNIAKFQLEYKFESIGEF